MNNIYLTFIVCIIVLQAMSIDYVASMETIGVWILKILAAYAFIRFINFIRIILLILVIICI